jgi:hypothetical protein
LRGTDPDPALYAYRLAIEEVLGRYEVDTSVYLLPTTERRLHELYSARRARLFLVRPDGHVSFAGAPADLGGLVTHLAGLFRKRDDAGERRGREIESSTEARRG